MSQEEARKLLDAWEFFDKHPEAKSWEGMSRQEFYRLVQIIAGTDNLVEAKEYFEGLASGTITGDMPTALLEAEREGRISPKQIADIKKTTQLTRNWLAKLGSKNAQDVAERQVSAAQVQAMVERVEEEKQATEKPPVPEVEIAETEAPITEGPKIEAPKVGISKPPVPKPGIRRPAIAPATSPTPKVAKAEIPPSPAKTQPAPLAMPPTPTPETPGFSFKIISAGSLPAASRAIASPLRSLISFAFPNVSSQNTTQAAAMSFMSIYGVSAKVLEPLKPKALTLGISSEQFDKFIKGVSRYEQSLPQLIYQGRQVDISPYQVEALFIQPGGDGVTATLPGVGFFRNIMRSAGQQLLGKVSSSIIKGLVKKGVEKAATAAAGAAVAGGVEAAVVTTAAAAGGPPGWILAAVALAKEVISKLVSHAAIWIKKHGKEVVGGLLVGSGVIIGGGTGLVLGIGGGAIALGTSGLKAAVGGIGKFLSFVLTGIILPSIGIPILVSLLTVVASIVIILFIINSGAYLVPPSELALKSENPYISIDKVADPAGPFQNSNLPLKITYKVTIIPKKGTLTNIKISNTCKVIKQGSQPACPAADIPAPDSISSSSPFSFSYEETYGGSLYLDSLVIDTVSVTADVTEEKGTSTSGSASISIGTPPTKCLVVDGTWPGGYKANIESAVGTLVSNYGSYVAKVCSSYDKIPLRYNPDSKGSYWGWNRRSHIEFYAKGVSTTENALYTLAHELGHSLIWGGNTASIWLQYLSYPGITSEVPDCFYAYGGDINERLPEAIAYLVIQPRCGSVQTKYPIHFQFLKRFIFN